MVSLLLPPKLFMAQGHEQQAGLADLDDVPDGQVLVAADGLVVEQIQIVAADRLRYLCNPDTFNPDMVQLFCDRASKVWHPGKQTLR
ncbi:hypothetical protein [Desulfonatronovibrio magnus]|uniref:hypothetical protein n=1 Tax=Desulfonatronovibrio magnus TaxID=698827 RepID=UPI0005EBB761|nr:hypothetical protein [Desulfonatronovibrio magnus]RQD60244.1 MAG: hypothetical protein D5R98_07220 [Desulfonatronovibrio sp. MSAO_Bac4]